MRPLRFCNHLHQEQNIPHDNTACLYSTGIENDLVISYQFYSVLLEERLQFLFHFKLYGYAFSSAKPLCQGYDV